MLRLTLNRPGARNALSSALMGALPDALEAAAADTSVRVVIIAAEGPVFSSGHDLKEMTARRADGDDGASRLAALFTQCSAMMQQIVRHAQAGDRRSAGHRHGGGLPAGGQLRSGGGVRPPRASPRPGVDIGLFCSTPMVALSRNVARKAAMEMLLTGEMVTADEARAASA